MRSIIIHRTICLSNSLIVLESEFDQVIDFFRRRLAKNDARMVQDRLIDAARDKPDVFLHDALFGGRHISVPGIERIKACASDDSIASLMAFAER